MASAYNLTEKSIRLALENCKSANQCANFLRVSAQTFKKYASLYVDTETGKTLYELAYNRRGIGISQNIKIGKREYDRVKQILMGNVELFIKPDHFRDLLIKHAILPEKCENCGYDERRITDYKMPIKLDYIDGDSKNKKLENLRFLCFNCYHNIVGNINGRYAAKYK